jgi:hypothetical protein
VTEVKVRGSWRKSSHSGNEGNCVELNESLDAVRDSKNPAGPVLSVSGLRGLVLAAKSGRIGR